MLNQTITSMISQALLCCQVAWVRRRAAVKGALPRSHLQADFDIVAPSGQALADLLLAEAECIRAVLEALAKVKGVEVRTCSCGCCCEPHLPELSGKRG